jgi:hypothetical protein
MSYLVSNRISSLSVPAGNFLGKARKADAAHRPLPLLHRDLGKRPAKRRRPDKPGFGCSTAGTGDLHSFRRRNERRSPGGPSLNIAMRPRVVGEPAAALWAALVVSRALIS